MVSGKGDMVNLGILEGDMVKGGYGVWAPLSDTLTEMHPNHDSGALNTQET